MAKILITGGSGLVGTRLTHKLLEAGHEVALLSRSTSSSSLVPSFVWDVDKQTIDEKAIAYNDCVIHLAGSGIADKLWTSKRKEEIISSRVNSIKLLESVFKQYGIAPKKIISASAIGYYGDSGSSYVDESFAGDDSFLSVSCQQWEDAVFQFSESASIVRIGIVLSTLGGALPKMMATTQLHFSSYFGNGTQYMSWIHIDDLVRMFMFLLEHPHLTGVYNGVSPNPITNKAMVHCIEEALGKKMFTFSIPSFILKLFMRDMSSILLFSNRVSSDRISSEGFVFRHKKIVPALRDLIQQKI